MGEPQSPKVQRRRCGGRTAVRVPLLALLERGGVGPSMFVIAVRRRSAARGCHGLGHGEVWKEQSVEACQHSLRLTYGQGRCMPGVVCARRGHSAAKDGVR